MLLWVIWFASFCWLDYKPDIHVCALAAQQVHAHTHTMHMYWPTDTAHISQPATNQQNYKSIDPSQSRCCHIFDLDKSKVQLVAPNYFHRTENVIENWFWKLDNLGKYNIMKHWMWSQNNIFWKVLISKGTVKRNTMYQHYALHSHSSLTHLTSPSSLFDVVSQCPDEMRIDALIWDGPSSNSPLYSSVYYRHSSVCQTCCNRSQEEMGLRLWMSQKKSNDAIK